MSLREETARYEKLTGESAEHIPIIKIGAYLDGVDKGIEELEKIKAEILNFIGGMNMCNDLDNEAFKKLDIRIDDIFDVHISELKGEN